LKREGWEVTNLTSSFAPSLHKGRLGRVLKREVAEGMRYRISWVVMGDNGEEVG